MSVNLSMIAKHILVSISGLPDGWEQAVTPEGAIYFIE